MNVLFYASGELKLSDECIFGLASWQHHTSVTLQCACVPVCLPLFTVLPFWAEHPTSPLPLASYLPRCKIVNKHYKLKLTRSPIQTPWRCRRGRMLNKLQMWTRKKERERSCELVWCLEIMCIFSHESIEKSLPHNLQEPNSRGEDNRKESETPDVNEEDGEREVLWVDLVLK